MAGAYREVAASGQPRLDAVDATIRWPRTAPRRHRYRRLLLPFDTRRGGGNLVLLSAPVADPSIDLRGKAP